jgi:hypothetical protein
LHDLNLIAILDNSGGVLGFWNDFKVPLDGDTPRVPLFLTGQQGDEHGHSQTLFEFACFAVQRYFHPLHLHTPAALALPGVTAQDNTPW